MSEYIGCQISLISKSDIRYIGTLHQIDSDTRTVALENVKSYGTEGRKAKADQHDQEIPPSDQIYEYIVFRGNDVLHLEIVQRPEDAHPPPQSSIPNDPAIVGSARPPQGLPNPQHQPPPPPQQSQQQWQPQQQQMPPYYPPYGFPPQQNNSRFSGPGGPHGFPNAPSAPPGYGMPPFNGQPGPGWYPGQQQQQQQRFPPGPPGQGQEPRPFTPHGQPQIPTGPSPLNNMQQHPNERAGNAANIPTMPNSGGQPSQQTAPDEPHGAGQDSKPTELSATPTRPNGTEARSQDGPQTQKTPSGKGAGRWGPNPRDNRVAVPLPAGKSPANTTFASIAASRQQTAPAPAPASVPGPSSGAAPAAANAAKQNQDVTQRAAAAVAAAMAKLGPTPGKQGPPAKNTAASSSAMDNLSNKVNEMRVGDRAGTNNTGSGHSGHFRGGGAGRGGSGPRHNHSTPRAPLEIPNDDFNFEESNAKFNKQNAAKQANSAATGEDTSSQLPTPDASASAANGTHDEQQPLAPIPITTYNKSSSFFDDISSELKDRQAAQEERDASRVGGASASVGGGAATRKGQLKKNFETFGQSNIDVSHHYRGRGGRGFGGRSSRGGGGRGYASRGRGRVGNRDVSGALA